MEEAHMPIVIGVTLAIAVALFARVTGLDRDRAFYPVVTIVVASLYLLFAVLGGGGSILLVELVGALVFIAAAVIGFKTSLWIVAAALAGHGLFDAVHHRLIANPGVPEWWPHFCASYDLAAGAILAVLLLADRRAGVSGSVARSA
jgi:hypothetical protein